MTSNIAANKMMCCTDLQIILLASRYILLLPLRVHNIRKDPFILDAPKIISMIVRPS